MSLTLPTRYHSAEVEPRIYEAWVQAGHFRSTAESGRTPYTVVIPPPNVTGQLHMGHALNNTIQDLLIRYRRMHGLNANWVPGTDHAGIATQNVVERQVAEEGTSRHALGREKFTERIWQWKEQYGNRIVEQLKTLGSSCDWDRLRFTLDEGLSRAVRTAFVRLFEQDLIYRGKYIVNRCPQCETALSDDEVDHEQKQGHLWHFKYPVSGARGRFVTVATTRPETMLGDTAVAVHPDDERYADLVGKTVMLPLMDREIPVIADHLVDPKFGTGAVKVTPAHDPNDFDMGRRHELEQIAVMDGAGVMNENAGAFGGLDRFEAREKVVAAIEEAGLLDKIEDYEHSVGHCYRCGTDVEPYLSDQWFVKMEPLAAAAIEASNARKVRFHPPRWEKVYLSWLENVRDWCISRQIWWGHRIPVWYCRGCEEVICAAEDPAKCPKCHSANIEQDPDVLDTWFSSALWPFSVFGWPDETDDLEYYYPTDTLVTGRDIIYFWVARMVMLGLRLARNIPFRDVYINGTILDEQGRKMAKMLGNGIDPLIMIKGGEQAYLGKTYECDGYGADAVRFSLIMLTSEGQDLKLSPTRFEEGRNFANKVWNAARFCLLRLSEGAGWPESEAPLDPRSLAFEDRWILSRLSHTIAGATKSLDAFRFNEAFRSIYNFTWNDFCSWYVELVKLRLTASTDPASRRAAERVLAYVLDHVLRLLHPLMPFLTEELWGHLSGLAPRRVLFEGEQDWVAECLMVSKWPEPREGLVDEEVAGHMKRVQDIVVAVRRIREKRRIPQGERPDVFFSGKDESSAVLVKRYAGLIAAMARSKAPIVGVGLEKPPSAAVEVLPDGEIYVPVFGDVKLERQRFTKDLDRTRKELNKIERQLQNEAFMKKAKPEIVARQGERRAELQEKVAKLERHLEEISG